jgi:hypothetical protein
MPLQRFLAMTIEGVIGRKKLKDVLPVVEGKAKPVVLPVLILVSCKR